MSTQTRPQRRPRVLMLTSTLPRWAGDAEPGFVLDLAREMGRDFDIELIAPHAPGAARHEVLDGLPITRFRYWWPRWQAAAYSGGMASRVRENPLRVLQLPTFFGVLVGTIVARLRRDPTIDLIHAHWLIPQGLAALLARLLVRRYVPIVCTSHGGDLFGLKGPLLDRIKKGILNRCDSISVVSHAMAARVKALAPHTHPAVIPMGTDLRDRFVPSAAPRSGPIQHLIFVGRLVQKKGVEHLLEAVAILRPTHPALSLEIVGHGPLLGSLVATADARDLGDCVRFTGPVPHDRLAERYQSADLAVFPFVEATDGDQEGFGLVMVEAMGCSCAVIASGLPAVRDVIRPGETGILVPPGDPRALAAAIAAALVDPEYARVIAQRGRMYAVENFDWGVARRRFTKVYQEMLNR